jgi:hypothetical protein
MPTKVNIGVSSFKYELIIVLLLWIALFCIVTRVIAGCEWFHYRLHCLSLLFAKSTVEPWGGVPRLFFFFYQELWLGTLPPLPKVVGSGCQFRPKTLPKRANNVVSCCPTRPNSVGSGWPKPKTLQKRVGSGCPTRPTDLGSGWPKPKTLQKGAGSGCPARLADLGSGCAAITNDIIICIINILIFYYY